MGKPKRSKFDITLNIFIPAHVHVQLIVAIIIGVVGVLLLTSYTELPRQLIVGISASFIIGWALILGLLLRKRIKKARAKQDE